jgi:UDP-N-acetyl-2-amino-2-deoxyglucuronate dehydrogenase
MLSEFFFLNDNILLSCPNKIIRVHRRELKFAIVGCGRIAQRHAKQIQVNGKLQAVCDVVCSKADELGKQYNSNIYYSLDDLLSNEQSLDVLVICTPNGLHVKHTILALTACVNVLCEKPMAITVADCNSMIKTAEVNNKKLFVVKQNRFNPPVVEVKGLLANGLLGKIYSVQLNCYWNRNASYYKDSWRGTKNLDGGTLFTQFSHFIDLLYWFFGDVKSVRAITANFAHKEIIEFEDTGIVAMEFHNGIVGGINYTVNSYSHNMEGSLTIFAEKGTVKIGGQYLNELEYQCVENFEIKNLPQGNGPNQYDTYLGSMSNHDKVYKNLVDVLLHNAPMYADACDGLKTVEIIEKIYNSAKKVNSEW